VAANSTGCESIAASSKSASGRFCFAAKFVVKLQCAISMGFSRHFGLKKPMDIA
jgi:hypothetical protein